MRSIFLWRILVVFVIAILVASLLMTGGYIYFSRDAYIDIKIQELFPEAEAIGYILMEHKAGVLDREAFCRLTAKLMESADSVGMVTDYEGAPIFNILCDELFQNEIYRKNIQKQIDMALLSGIRSQGSDILLSDGNRGLYVCIPMRNEKGDAIGAVYLIKSSGELIYATNRLNGSLMLAVALVVPVMLFLSSLSFKRMTEPLHKMGEVAIQMSKGDFEIRADENEVGEIGLLARALNNLCDALVETIRELRAEKIQLKEILASFSEGVAATDSTGALTVYNPALTRLFGAVRVSSRKDLIADDTIWEKFDYVFHTGKPQEMRYPMPNDSTIWITFAPIVSDEGERMGVVALFKDMTEIEKLEKSRTDYVQNISHELRTPLTAMRGLLEPLADGMVQDEKDRQRYYKIMMREVLRLSRLITDMMQLSRLQAGTEYMELSEVDINEILEDVMINYTREALERGIRLILDTPKLPHVITDPDRIEQILVILLSNAMRYTPQGGTITLKGEVHSRVNISVIDTGKGIPEEDLPYLFDRFYTVDKSRNEGNTGLGLSIAKRLLDKLDEKIIVESALGQGTSFTFTLKKYVSNAIALGPAQDQWESLHIDGILMEQPTAAPEDALYELLPEIDKREKKDKKEKDKKLENKKHTEKKTAEKKVTEKAAKSAAKQAKGKERK